MEKLIELLNKYEQEEWCWRLKYWKLHNKYYDDYDRKDEEIRLISKWYGFIKWLVENDKINTESWPLYWFHFIMHNRQPYSLYETILMILAISDTPIEDLISYLK